MPIIMLTARSEERDELQGFDLGVDEYISKPFSPKILVARVNAILRRTLAATDVLEAGGITIDKAAHIVKIDGKPIELSYKEFELLTYFVENQGIALSREKILNNVWNYDYFGDARTIDTHVKKLRSKLGDKGEYIQVRSGEWDTNLMQNRTGDADGKADEKIVKQTDDSSLCRSAGICAGSSFYCQCGVSGTLLYHAQRE